MTILAAALSLLGGLTATAPDYREIEFGAPIDDWFIFDLDGDGWREVMVFHPLTEEGRPYSMAQRSGDQWKIERGLLRRDVVAMALGDFGLAEGRQVALLGTDSVRFLGAKDDRLLVMVGPEIPFTNLIRTALSGPPGFWHWPTDIDGDGHDDLFLPGEQGIILHFADGEGAFSEASLLSFAGTRRVTPDSSGHLDYLRSYPRPIFEDLDVDGRKDLVWFDSQGLFAHLQTSPRSFASDEPLTFPLPWLSGRDSGAVLEQTEVNLEDLNGDGRPDLFLSRMSTPASGISDLRTTLVVLLNREKLFFSRRPDFALRVQGVIGNGPHFVDVDGDGLKDLIFGSYGAGISDALQRMMGSVKITFHIHRGLAKTDSPFENQPSRLLDVELDKDDFGRWGARKNFDVGEDFDGDGIGDLFRMESSGKNAHILRVFKGRTTRESALEFAVEPTIEFAAKDLKTMSFRTMEPDRAIALILVRETSIGVLQLR